jgi:hypothetical protein
MAGFVVDNRGIVRPCAPARSAGTHRPLIDTDVILIIKTQLGGTILFSSDLIDSARSQEADVKITVEI